MDNGEVIPGLDEEWTFAGAKLMEWAAGFVLGMMIQEIFFKGSSRGIIIVLGAVIVLPQFLAQLRRSQPDGERGVRNLAMTTMGLAPPGIPAPSVCQPYWSGMPMSSMPEEKMFIKLGLDEVFFAEKDEEEDEDDF